MNECNIRMVLILRRLISLLFLHFMYQISYSQRLVIRIAQSSSRHVINVNGQGNEPKLEFSSTLIEFGPVLPHSSGDEKEVMVKNPSSFPVEIYSLEFDKQYLEEEKVGQEYGVLRAIFH